MNVPLLFQMVAAFGLLSLLSIGGANATLPEIHRLVVTQLHWMDDAVFAQLVAIGQTAPGPNVLIVSVVGWQAAGLVGLFVATVAVLVPSSVLAVVAGRLVMRYESNWIIPLLKRALAPVAIGLMLASGLVMVKAAYTGLLTLAVVAVTASMILFTRLTPLWGVAVGAIVGIIAHRLAVV